ncbi:DUF488 domain-containing protein [Flavivirga abyssicola]|uniref:DUF488 domain-containing protein n=1 Tax=Flavivirga abyssicola TaxID=3063533 RepID=UPI0026DF64D4|nr:DUF488 domain-containing protein [Flavivirga sp. MEBiC07777]WVK14321.1 DUF488 domain-containing protein [Flavivirga sp. MEBiC07777]
MVKLYTIGFTKKNAEKFFDLLKSNEVNKIVDTRINNTSQLSGFAKGNDLKFFAKELNDINYQHNLDFAPTKELLSKYRKGDITWEKYEQEYLDLLDFRKISKKTDIKNLHKNCLLCSEHTAEKCHRRLLAEYFQEVNNDVEIIHLT